MSKPQVVYVICMRATAEQTWNGLISPEMTHQYWMHDNLSDWKAGSKWAHSRTDASGTVDIVGEVVASEPPRRLVLTWVQPKDAGGWSALMSGLKTLLESRGTEKQN